MQELDIDIAQLARDGFITIPLTDLAGVQPCVAPLLDASARFFASDAEKLKWKGKSTEEGYSAVPGEKQLFTVKALDRTPAVLREPAAAFWREAALPLDEIVQACALHCGYERDAFATLVEPCLELGEYNPSLLRLFQYERPPQGYKVTAEPHRDLGLLTLVIGGTPGLEALQSSDGGQWLDLEADGPTATVLVGQTLRFLTRDAFTAGVHRVKCHALAGHDSRQSLVFALRPYGATLDLARFGGATTYPDGTRQAFDGKSATELLKSIAKTHVNINAGQDVRLEQRTTSRVYAPPPGPPPPASS